MYLIIKGGHIKVNFLDTNLRIYLAYYFSPSKKYTDKVFLDEIWYNNYTSESSETESYRMHFVFDEDGNVNYRKYDEVNHKTQDFESKEQSDVTGLYESYPDFEKYEDLIKLERNFPLEIMKI